MIRKSTPAVAVRSQNPRERDDGVSQGMLRSARQGFPLVVLCDGKTQQGIVSLARKLLAQHQHLLVPRVAPEVARALLRLNRRAVYHELSRAVTVCHPTRRPSGDVVIVTAGTADTPIAEEALVTADVLGAGLRQSAMWGGGIASSPCPSSQAHAGPCRGGGGRYGWGASERHRRTGQLSCHRSTNEHRLRGQLWGNRPLLTMLNSCASGVGS